MTQLVVAALEQAGLEANIVFVPWARGYRMVAERSADGSFPYIRTAEREEEMLFSDTLYTAREVVVVAESSSIEFTGDPESLEGLRYCLPLGYAVQPVLQDLVDRGALQLVRPESLEACNLLVPRDDREAALFLQQFNNGLQALRESVEYERLFPAYGQNDPLYGEL